MLDMKEPAHSNEITENHHPPLNFMKLFTSYIVSELHAYVFWRESADTYSTSCSLQTACFFMNGNMAGG